MRRYKRKPFNPPTKEAFAKMNRQRLRMFRQALGRRRAATVNAIKNLGNDIGMQDFVAQLKADLSLIEGYLIDTKRKEHSMDRETK